MRFHIKNIKFKIVFFSTLCIAIIGIAGTSYLYTYMNSIIAEKAEDIDTLYLESIQKQLNIPLTEINTLGVLCASSYEVNTAMRHSGLNSSSAIRDVFSAQSVLNSCLHSSNISPYINKMFVFNEEGLVIQTIAAENAAMNDLPNLLASDFYQQYTASSRPLSTVMPSVTPFRGDCLVTMFPISNYISPSVGGYLYMEIDLSLITDILTPYSTLNPILAVPEHGPVLHAALEKDFDFSSIPFASLKDGDTFTMKDQEFRADIRPLPRTGISIYNCTDISAITIDNKRRTYILSIVIASVVLTSLGITVIITNYITTPIQKLIARIKRISESDFSVDLKSETSNDEIGEVFKVVNEMSLSIDKLLRENAEQNEQKKNIEIDLLQSQVNPHFLYNTLDSIHWMAVIQKNPGICNITRCLSNLLKNMSKGFSQKISLEEELSLLNDYITIQSIRYMETFELINHIDKSFYHYRIVKLTLQPLVENAIFHGIEPSGVYGTIILDAAIDGDYLLITVTDSGVGMSEEELAHVLEVSEEKTRHSMNGIGIGNVHNRLSLVYGPPCGLHIESKKGQGTCITVRILKEEVLYDLSSTVGG